MPQDSYFNESLHFICSSTMYVANALAHQRNYSLIHHDLSAFRFNAFYVNSAIIYRFSYYYITKYNSSNLDLIKRCFI